MEAQGGGSEAQAAFQDPLEAFSDIVRLEKNLWVLGALSPSPPSPSSAALACYFPSLTPAESLSCARRWALGMQRQVLLAGLPILLGCCMLPLPAFIKLSASQRQGSGRRHQQQLQLYPRHWLCRIEYSVACSHLLLLPYRPLCLCP